MNQERRQYQRLVPDSRPSVYLGESWNGLLFDLCEGGLSVYGLPPRNRHQVIYVVFDLPGVNGQIRGKAEVAWTSASGNRTGLRYLDLTESSREPLREWISARSYATKLAATEKEAAQPVEVNHALGALASPISQERREEGLARTPGPIQWNRRARRWTKRRRRSRSAQGFAHLGKLRHPRRVIVAVVIFAPLFVFLGHVLANRGYNPQAAETTSLQEPVPSYAKDPGAAADRPPAANASFPATVPFDVPGFVLQVGAMTHESNADDLREALEQKNFPAFEFRRGSSGLYRVSVGPYRDADLAARVKDRLEVEGFEAVVKRWSPE